MRQKGLDLLLSAIAAQPPSLPLVIAGAGSPREERRLRELVRPVRQHVRLAGRVHGQQKEELLRDCAFLVMPSRYETFSLAALEAMAHGKPVVCFDLPQLAWIPGDAAVRVPPYDARALGAAIGELSGRPEHRVDLGRRAYATSGDYDWDVIGERYRSLVSAMLDGGGHPAGE